MSLGTTHRIDAENNHVVTVHENMGGGWSFLKEYKNIDREQADWDARVFMFEEATNMRIHTDGQEAVYAAMAERGMYPPNHSD